MIFTPTSIRISASETLRYSNRSSKPASAKYIIRRPRIAKMLLVNTSSGSAVTAKTAGIESVANTTSAPSIRIIASANGVSTSFPASRATKCFP